MQENSLVVFVGKVEPTVKEYLSKNNLIVPIVDETTATVTEIRETGKKCLFPVAVLLDIYPNKLGWNIKDWKEIQGPTNVDINEITNASTLEQDVEEYYVIPDGVTY